MDLKIGRSHLPGTIVSYISSEKHVNSITSVEKDNYTEKA
jgi:hypothetical protein